MYLNAPTLIRHTSHWPTLSDILIEMEANAFSHSSALFLPLSFDG